VYDVLGREIATLVRDDRPAGDYEAEFNTASVPHPPATGVYFYQLRAGGLVETKKMLHVK
jgi:hypothetical protein